MSHSHRWGPLIAAGALCASCAVGPDYERPAVDVPASYGEKPAEPAAGAPPLDTEWWSLFGDPTLTALEVQARDANQDLQLAVARVAEARATARIANSEFYPTVTLDPAYRTLRQSPNRSGSTSATGVYTQEVIVPFDLSYEIDLWGRVRRTFESATAQAHASESDYRVVALTLAGDVAAQYFAIRSLDAQSATLADSIGIFGDQVRLVEARFRAGLVSELDVAQARTQLSTALARQADVQRQRAEAEHALAVLCGRPASDFSVAVQPLDLAPPEIPAGVPSELLEHRPDVAEAEQNLVAANAEVGVAEALFFPQVRLTGAAGLDSASFGDLLKWESRIWALGPSISAPIFEGGRLRANLSGAQARYEEHLATYRQTVLGAFRDVEDALVGVRLRAVQGDAVGDAVTAAARAVAVSRSQYDHGIADYLQVIVAQSAHLELELQAAQVQQQRLDSTVQLVKAIGGGWQ
ncbi:MAG: efflux transporter outer membrane subunit [Myxococcota bacterium]